MAKTSGNTKDVITALYVARGLMPYLFGEKNDWLTTDEDDLQLNPNGVRRLVATEEERLATFFLWPPDLFAYTSAILSQTGAYNAVISPPSGAFVTELSTWLGSTFGPEFSLDYEQGLREHYGVEKHSDIRGHWQSSFSWPPRIDLSSVPRATPNDYSSRDYVLGKARLFDCVDDEGAVHNDANWGALVRRVALEWRLRIEVACRANDKENLLPELLASTSSRWMDVESKYLEVQAKNVPDAKVRESLIRDDRQARKSNPYQNRMVPAELSSIWSLLRSVMTTGEEGQHQSESIHDLLCETSWKEDMYFKSLMRVISFVERQERFDEECVDFFFKTFSSNEEAEMMNLATNEEIANKSVEKAIEWSYARIDLTLALQALITLHAIADEASTGFGVRSIELRREGVDPDLDAPDQVSAVVQGLIALSKSGESIWKNYHNGTEDYPQLLLSINRRMNELGTLATINPQHCRILPKRHTPSVGITLRSISCNLGFHRSAVDVRWACPDSKAQNPLEVRLSRHPAKSDRSEATRMSILLLPWPLKVSARDFREVEAENVRGGEDGLFTFSPGRTSLDQDLLFSAIQSALLETESVDMVVMPECALTESEIKVFEAALKTEYQVLKGNRSELASAVSCYIAGVRRESNDLDMLGDNMVWFKKARFAEGAKSVAFPDQISERDIQYKHHKWKLNESQIVAYSLGHSLAPGIDWWEAIRIRKRRVTFMNIGERITVCPLICEDLARQDPIADLIRTVGPTLVVTILMDGPQLRGRWSSNYASVLADDPGCAVITLSSIGMVDRWKPAHAKEKSRVVAHWRDSQNNSREIELECGAIGVLLSVTVVEGYEKTSDGRQEVFPTSSLKLGAIKQIFKLEDELARMNTSA